MDSKRLAAAARIAVGVSMAALAGGTGQVNAAPLDPPPPSPASQPDPNPSPPPPGIPAEKCWRYGRQGPGGPKGGGGVPVYPQQCPPAAPPPAPPPS
jgi:hypothetical protein